MTKMASIYFWYWASVLTVLAVIFSVNILAWGYITNGAVFLGIILGGAKGIVMAALAEQYYREPR